MADITVNGAKLSNDGLWRNLEDTYYVLHSDAVTAYVHGLIPRDQECFAKGLAYYDTAMQQLAKASHYKFQPQQSYFRNYVSTSNVVKLVKMKVDIVTRLVVDQPWKLDILSLIDRFLTRKNFVAASNALAKARYSFVQISWKQAEFDPSIENVHIDGLTTKGLVALIGAMTPKQIAETILPQINNDNLGAVLTALAAVPRKGYADPVLFGLAGLICSGRVYIPANAPLENNSPAYWGNLSRNKARGLLESLDRTSLLKIAPFMNLSVEELRSINLIFTHDVVVALGHSRNPASRALWIASQQSAVGPVLSIYKLRGWPLSSFERNLVGLYSGMVSRVEGLVPSLQAPAGWSWVDRLDWSQEMRNIWRNFKIMATPYANTLLVEPVGGWTDGEFWIVPYISIWGEVDSTRKETDIIGYFLYDSKTKKMFKANPDPESDKTFALVDAKAQIADAAQLVKSLRKLAGDVVPLK